MNKTIIILFILLIAATLYPNVSCFTDTQILPKYISTFIIGGIMGTCISITLLTKRMIVWNFKTISVIIVMLCTIEAGIGILQFCNLLPPASHYYSITGSFDNPAGFAICLCIEIPFNLYLLRKHNKHRLNLCYLSSFLIILTGIILSESRAGLFSTTIILVLYFIHKYKSRIFFKKNIGLLSIILLFFIILILFVSYYAKRDSADGRLLIWRCTWEMIKDSPFTGHGTGAFNKYYMDYQAAYFEKHPNSRFALLADNVKHPFNEYLSITVQFGLIGLLILTLIVIFLYSCYRKAPSREGYFSLLTLLSIAIFSFFSYPFTYPFTWIITIFCLVSIIMKTYGDVYIKHFFLRSSIGICLLSISFVSLYMTSKRIKAELNWKQTVEAVSSGETNEALLQYATLMKSLGNNPYFLYNYTVELYLNEDYINCLKIAQKCQSYWSDYDLELIQAEAYTDMNIHDKAIMHLQKARYMCPDRFIPLYELFQLYKTIGKIEDAKNIAKIIINKPVKIPSSKINFIQTEIRAFLDKQNMSLYN